MAGQPAGTFTQSLRCNDLWNIGTLDWNGTTGSFIPNGVTQTAREGVCLGN